MKSTKKMDKPPLGNTGAQNTCPTGLRACVDWLQATLKNVDSPHDVIDIIGIDRDLFTLFETGQYGYRQHYRLGHIAIYFDGSRDMGIHIEMSGQGCREFEEYTKKDWSHFFALLLNWEVKFSRLDVAIDDFIGYFTLDQVINKIKRGHVSSRFKSAREQKQYSLSDGETEGATIYFGKPSSRIMIRMYDKFLERQSKGKELHPNLKCWQRTELQLRNDRAHQAATILAFEFENIGSLAFGVLSNYVNFLIPTKDTNKSRWKVCPWWEEFLQGVDKLKLTQVAPDATIERAQEWIHKQVAPTLAMLFEAYNGDYEVIQSVLNEGKPRLTEKHENMINRFKEDTKNLQDRLDQRRQKIKQDILKPRQIKKEHSRQMFSNDFEK